MFLSTDHQLISNEKQPEVMCVVRPIKWIKKISYHYTCLSGWIIFGARETFGLTFVYSLPRLPYNNFLPTWKIQSRLTTFTREEIQEHVKDMCGILLWLSDSACTIVGQLCGPYFAEQVA